MGEVSSESGTPYAITVNQDAISLTYSGTTISPAEFEFEPVYVLRDSDSGEEVTTYLSFNSASQTIELSSAENSDIGTHNIDFVLTSLLFPDYETLISFTVEISDTEYVPPNQAPFFTDPLVTTFDKDI